MRKSASKLSKRVRERRTRLAHSGGTDRSLSEGILTPGEARLRPLANAKEVADRDGGGGEEEGGEEENKAVGRLSG